MRAPISPYHHQYLLPVLIIPAILVGREWCLIVVLVWISLMTRDIEYFFWLFISHSCAVFGGMSFKSLAHFSVRLSPYWVAQSSLYILDTSLIWDLWFANIFSHLVCFFFLDSVLWSQNVMILVKSSLSIFVLLLVLWCQSSTASASSKIMGFYCCSLLRVS